MYQFRPWLAFLNVTVVGLADKIMSQKIIFRLLHNANVTYTLEVVPSHHVHSVRA